MLALALVALGAVLLVRYLRGEFADAPTGGIPRAAAEATPGAGPTA